MKEIQTANITIIKRRRNTNISFLPDATSIDWKYSSGWIYPVCGTKFRTSRRQANSQYNVNPGLADGTDLELSIDWVNISFRSIANIRNITSSLLSIKMYHTAHGKLRLGSSRYLRFSKLCKETFNFSFRYFWRFEETRKFLCNYQNTHWKMTFEVKNMKTAGRGGCRHCEYCDWFRRLVNLTRVWWLMTVDFIKTDNVYIYKFKMYIMHTHLC